MHDLSVAGLDAFAYREGEPGWHGAGLEIPAGIVMPSEAIACDPILSSDTYFAEVSAATASGPRKVPGRVALVRSADDAILHIASDRYRTIGPVGRGAVLDAMQAAVPGSYFSCAGWRSSDLWWGSIKLPSTVDLGPLPGGKRDIVGGYGSFFDEFTGKMPACVGVHSTRAVCQNTVGHALSEAVKGAEALRWQIRHLGDTEARTAEVGAAVAAALAGWVAFQAFAEAAAAASMTRADVSDLVDALIPATGIDAATGAEVVTAPAQRKRDLIMSAWDSPRGVGVPLATVWGAYNAVTEFVTWGAPVRGQGDAADLVRWSSAVLGDGALLAGQAQQFLSAVL